MRYQKYIIFNNILIKNKQNKLEIKYLNSMKNTFFEHKQFIHELFLSMEIELDTTKIATPW